MSTELPDGAIVSWVSPKSLSIANLRAALTISGFDEKLAKDMAPRSAFARAAKQLDDDRIIRKVEEDDASITFQFTKEFLSQGELKYEREYQLDLNKETGKVTCENTEMESTAQKLVDHHIDNREAADITRLVQRMFEAEKGDLIPVRAQGGCYFVPPQHRELVSKTSSLLKTIGGKLNVWEISMRSAATQSAVEESTLEYMLSEVDEFNKSLDNVDQESKPAVVQRRLERVATLRAKLEGYAPLLRGLYSEINNAIQSSENLLRQKVNGDYQEEIVVEPEVSSAFTQDDAELLAELESSQSAAHELIANLESPIEGDIPLPDDLAFDGCVVYEDETEVDSADIPDIPMAVDLDEIDRLLATALPPIPG